MQAYSESTAVSTAVHNVNSVNTVNIPPPDATMSDESRQYLKSSVADNTRRAYQSDWRTFTAWCAATHNTALPATPHTITNYLSHLATSGKKTSTIDRARAAIRKAHETAGYDDPTASILVKQVLHGIHREHGTAPTQKAPVLAADLRRMVVNDPARAYVNTLIDARNRALLLIGFASACRREEIAAMCAEHLTFTPDGVTIFLPHSKTDQEGQGRLIGIVYGRNITTCPVRALQEWLQASGIVSGHIYRHVTKSGLIRDGLTTQTIAAVIKQACQAIGLDATQYSGHSLRAGFVSQAAKNGVSISNIMKQSGHRDPKTVDKYIRKVNIFEDNPSACVGL